MRTRKCVYAGSFDPLTNGHLWMIQEGAKLFDELIVAVGVNPAKKSAFSVEDRLGILRESLADLKNVQVTSFSANFLADYARTIQSDYILRGIRGESDYEYERGMRYINEELNSKLTSVFLIPPKQLIETSSSMVKSLIGPVGWEAVIQHYVPTPVYRAILLSELQRSFRKTWSKVTQSDSESVFVKVCKHYSESHRRYHDLTHVSSCLTELSQLPLSEKSRTEIELAIWFHDVIYDSSMKDNEAKSADFFREIAERAAMDRHLVDTVCRMILATQKHEVPSDLDTPELKTFLDIDLSILGASPERFHEYNEGIKSEYGWVPFLIYNSKRKKVLKHFLDRQTLYFTAEFQSRYETSARANIRAILES